MLSQRPIPMALVAGMAFLPMASARCYRDACVPYLLFPSKRYLTSSLVYDAGFSFGQSHCTTSLSSTGARIGLAAAIRTYVLLSLSRSPLALSRPDQADAIASRPHPSCPPPLLRQPPPLPRPPRRARRYSQAPRRLLYSSPSRCVSGANT